MLDSIVNWLLSNAYYFILAIAFWMLLKRALGPVARLVYLAAIAGILVLFAVMIIPCLNFSAIFTNTIEFFKLLLMIVAAIIGGCVLIGFLLRSAGRRYSDQRKMDYAWSLWKNSRNHWWDNN